MSGLGVPTDQRATLGMSLKSELWDMPSLQKKNFGLRFQMIRKTWRIVHRLGFISLSLITCGEAMQVNKSSFSFFSSFCNHQKSVDDLDWVTDVKAQFLKVQFF